MADTSAKIEVSTDTVKICAARGLAKVWRVDIYDLTPACQRDTVTTHHMYYMRLRAGLLEILNMQLGGADFWRIVDVCNHRPQWDENSKRIRNRK